MSSEQVAVLPVFDPQSVPVVGVDRHLPAVDPVHLSPAALRARFVAPPVWTPEVTRERRFTERPPAAAAVLVPVVRRPEPTVLLTQRTHQLSTHSGQVAFPGGKVDDADVDVVAAALREAEEEVGLSPKQVEVLGTLPVYVTGTAFWVTPVVALVDPDLHLRINHDEVAQVFEVPLAYLMNPAHHQRHRLEWQGQTREWFSMPYLDHASAQRPSERFIWGATAGMLRNLYRFLVA